MAREFEYILQLHSMCTDELQQLLDYTQKFIKESKDVLDNMCYWGNLCDSSNSIELIAYDQFLTIMTNIMDSARKFKIHLVMNNIDDNPSLTLFKNMRWSTKRNGELHHNAEIVSRDKKNDQEAAEAEIQASNGQDILKNSSVSIYSDYSVLPIEENNDSNFSTSGTQSSNQVCHYVEKDITGTYLAGSEFNATITYIKDIMAMQFYVCDIYSPELAQVFQISDALNLRQYTGLPSHGEVFGIVLDNKILRAIRLNNDDEFFESTSNISSIVHKGFLLDFGEEIQLNAADIMYHLPIEYRNIPAQAMLCQLFDVIGHTKLNADEMKELLLRLEYGRAKFRVNEIIENILLLELIIEHTTANESQPPKVANAKKNKSNGKSKTPLTNGLTAEELEILYEEPLSTSNAMKAVMGYDPKDDRRLCRFYNPKTQSCFKGANCHKEHSLRQPDGWTKDVLPSTTIIENNMPTMQYEKNTIISITPTFIGQLDRFYAQVNDPLVPIEPLIWNAEDIPEWKRLKSPPLVYELVLAKYEDGLYYRAKVMEAEDGAKMVKVFYVDYGNQQIVHFRDLARCDVAIAHIPFQSILCRLANLRVVTKSSDILKKGVKKLCNLILNKTLKVEVVSHYEDLIVRIVERDFEKVPDVLIKMGCMIPYKMVTLN